MIILKSPLRPGHAVRTGAGRNPARNLKRLQVDHRDVVLAGDPNVGVRSIGYNQDAFRTSAQLYSLDLLPLRTIEHHEFTAFEIGDEYQPAVRRKLQAIGALGLYVERLCDLFGSDINDRNSTIARVRGPELPAIRRQIDGLRSFAHWNYGLAPTKRTGNAIDGRDAVGPDVG